MVLVAVQLSVLGLYLPPVFKAGAVRSAPDDHFSAGPDRRVTRSGSGRVAGAGGCPTVAAGIISPAAVQIAASPYPPQTIISLSVHTAVGYVSGSGRVGGAGGGPTIGAGIISSAGIQIGIYDQSFRPRRSFRCHSTLPCAFSASGRVGGAGGCPTVRAGIVSPASVQIATSSAPDDHLAAGPDCRVIDRAAGALVVLVAVQLSVPGLYLPPVLRPVPVSAPDDHFAAGPHCRVKLGQRRVGDAGGVQLSVLGLYLPPVLKYEAF